MPYLPTKKKLFINAFIPDSRLIFFDDTNFLAYLYFLYIFSIGHKNIKHTSFYFVL